MIALLTFPTGYDQFSLSPFCVKAAYLLEMSGQSWQREDLNDPRKMPHAKLPVLRADGQLIADSEAIRRWLEKRGADFDPGLSAAQKAQSLAYIRMAEEHVYFHIVMDRWGNDAVWPTIRDNYFKVIPWLIRRPVTSRIRKFLMTGLTAHGIARMTEEERMEKLEKDLIAIAQPLKGSPFLFGDMMTSADASVAPMLANASVTPVETLFSRRVNSDPVLMGYIQRVKDTMGF